MSIKKALLVTCIAVGSISPAMARVNFDVDVLVAPPPAEVEVIPVARPGYTWVPGYWGWEDGQHIWVNGRYIENRPGYYYAPARWEHHGRGYRLHHGYWHR